MSEATSADQLEQLVGSAEEILDKLDEQSAEGDDLDVVLDDLRDLYQVAEEAEDLLDDIDLTELPSAVDAGELVDAIDVGEIPEAIQSGDTDGLVDLRALLRAINLRQLFDATDVRAMWTDKEELEEAVNDVTDGGDDDDGLLSGDEDEDGLIGGDDGGITDMDADIPSVGGEDGGGLGNIPDEGYQVMIQKKAMEGVDKFREGVLEAHDKLQAMHDENRERMRRQHDDKGVSSRNPTAHSTIPTDRLDTGGSATQLSTVPSRTRYSTAPTRERIYGNRFRNRDDSK